MEAETQQTKKSETIEKKKADWDNECENTIGRY